MPASPYHRRLSRPARHLIKSLLRTRSHHRASELRAAGGALNFEVRSPVESRVETPTHPGDALVQRVRLGRETRDLLRRLLAARNIHVQRALVKEIRANIANRIALHVKRSKALETARRRARVAAAWTRVHAKRGSARVARAWKDRGGWERPPQVRDRTARAVPERGPAPAPRSRRPRAGRWSRSRARRTAA